MMNRKREQLQRSRSKS